MIARSSAGLKHDIQMSKITYVKTWGVKRGESVWSKRTHYRKLTVYGINQLRSWICVHSRNQVKTIHNILLGHSTDLNVMYLLCPPSCLLPPPLQLQMRTYINGSNYYMLVRGLGTSANEIPQ